MEKEQTELKSLIKDLQILFTSTFMLIGKIAFLIALIWLLVDLLS